MQVSLDVSNYLSQHQFSSNCYSKLSIVNIDDDTFVAMNRMLLNPPLLASIEDQDLLNISNQLELNVVIQMRDANDQFQGVKVFSIEDYSLAVEQYKSLGFFDKDGKKSLSIIPLALSGSSAFVITFFFTDIKNNIILGNKIIMHVKSDKTFRESYRRQYGEKTLSSTNTISQFNYIFEAPQKESSQQAELQYEKPPTYDELVNQNILLQHQLIAYQQLQENLIQYFATKCHVNEQNLKQELAKVGLYSCEIAI